MKQKTGIADRLFHCPHMVGAHIRRVPILGTFTLPLSVNKLQLVKPLSLREKLYTVH